MDAQEIRRIEQRLAEGYYDADAEALQTMQRLIAELRRFREEEALAGSRSSRLIEGVRPLGGRQGRRPGGPAAGTAPGKARPRPRRDDRSLSGSRGTGHRLPVGPGAEATAARFLRPRRTASGAISRTFIRASRRVRFRTRGSARYSPARALKRPRTRKATSR